MKEELVVRNRKGIKRPPFTEEWKRKLSESHFGKNTWSKGRRLSEEHKKKLSLAKIGYIPKHKWQKGCIPWNKGLKGYRAGEEHYNWKGGISYEPYPIDWTDSLKEAIREKNDFICYECGTHQEELDRKLDIHHIDYNKKNLDPKNLIPLCRSCHIKTNYNRDYWINHFSISDN